MADQASRAKTKKTKAKPRKGEIRITEKKTKNETSKEQIKILQRQTWALDLKRQGLSYRKLARRLKELKLVEPTYSEGLAYKDVRDGMARILAEQKEVAEDNLRLDLDRLEEMFERVWALALPPAEDDETDPPPPDPVYFGSVLAIMDKREKLLNYKALWAQPQEPNFNINVDWDKFTPAELLEIRSLIQRGVDAVVAITEVQQKRSAAGEPPATA